MTKIQAFYRDLLVLGFINKQYRGVALTEKDQNFRKDILASIAKRAAIFSG